MKVSLIYFACITFFLRYRQTSLGPLWILIGPSVFIFVLGFLFAEVSSNNSNEFIPHLSIGLVVWTLINGLITNSPGVFKKNRGEIISGTRTIEDIIAIEVIIIFLGFIHLLPIIMVIAFVYNIGLNWASLQSLIGLILILINGIWVTYFFGILGAQYHDIRELFQSFMRIIFLATPIIWMPNNTLNSDLIGHIMIYNPFYHFLEIVRAPLLGQSPALLSWAVAITFALLGSMAALQLKKKSSHLIPFWVQ